MTEERGATIQGDAWRVSLPHGWQAEVDEDCHTALPSDGHGALQFSSARKPGQLVTNEDLLEFAEDDLRFAPAVEVTFGDFSGIAVDFELEGVYWCKWWLRRASTLLFVTYNSDLAPEKVQLESVLHTLRPA